MLSSQKLGERIGLLRKRAGLTQAGLAESLGVSRTTMVAIEKGERPPGDAEIVRLGVALAVPVHDLLREPFVGATVSRRFRVTPGRTRDASVIEQAVERLRRFGSWYTELERLHDLVRVPAPLESIDTYRATQPLHVDPHVLGKEAAMTVRGLLGLGDEPVRQLEERLEAHAALRIFSLDLPPMLSGILIWSDEIGACVALNRKHPKERRRWSLTHELGHFLRDREAGDILDREEGFRSTDPSEVFAEGFAVTFLMPPSGLARRFADRCRVSGGRFSSFDLNELARYYEVSFEAMTRRLEEERLLPLGTMDRLAKSRIRRRDLESLPVGGRSPGVQPFPRRYLDLALAAFDQEMISEGRLCELLDTDRVAARHLFQEFLERKRAHYGEDQELEVVFGGEDLRGR